MRNEPTEIHQQLDEFESTVRKEFKACPFDLSTLEKELDYIRKARTLEDSYLRGSSYFFLALGKITKAISKVRGDPVHHPFVLECVGQMVQFAEWSHTKTTPPSITIQRYFSELISVLECTDKAEKATILKTWLGNGLSQQLLRMLEDRPTVAINFVTKIIKMLGTKLNESFNLESFSVKLYNRFVMEGNDGYSLRSALRLLNKLIDNRYFVPNETLVTFLDEGFAVRLVRWLALHSNYDIEALDCICSIGKRLFRESHSFAQLYVSSLGCLSVEKYIEESPQLQGVSKKQKMTLRGWLNDLNSPPAWSN